MRAAVRTTACFWATTIPAMPANTASVIFTAYPRIVNEINKDVLLNWKDYFSETELNEYVDDFLNEGYFGDQLLMFPLAKSTELFFLNKTLFERFSDNTDFSNFNNVFALCNEYYDYSDGKTMMQINDYYYYFLTQMHSLGGNFIENNTINTDSREFEEVFMPLAKAAIYGGLSTDDGYASDKWKTAELISSIGSTAGIMYMRDYVTYENGDDENIETMVYTYPTFDGAKPAVIQRGTGIFGVKSDDEKKNEAESEIWRQIKAIPAMVLVSDGSFDGDEFICLYHRCQSRYPGFCVYRDLWF